jgi:hypothetical protein
MSTLILVRNSQNALCGYLQTIWLLSIMSSEVIHGTNQRKIIGTLIGLCIEAQILLSSCILQLILLKLVISY